MPYRHWNKLTLGKSKCRTYETHWWCGKVVVCWTMGRWRHCSSDGISNASCHPTLCLTVHCDGCGAPPLYCNAAVPPAPQHSYSYYTALLQTDTLIYQLFCQVVEVLDRSKNLTNVITNQMLGGSYSIGVGFEAVLVWLYETGNSVSNPSQKFGSFG